MCDRCFQIQPPHSYYFHVHKKPWGFNCVGRCSRSSSTANRWIFDFDKTEWTMQVIDLLVILLVFGYTDGISRDGEWNFKLRIWESGRLVDFFSLSFRSFPLQINMFPFLTIFCFFNKNVSTETQLRRQTADTLRQKDIMVMLWLCMYAYTWT